MVYWPVHIRQLAANPKDWYALHDALEELGLTKCAAHFVEGHCGKNICTFAELIVKNVNPNWSNEQWVYNNDKQHYLEMQQELEEWWKRLKF